MIEKRVIYIDDMPIALKYDHKYLQITIGGSARIRETLERIVLDYFEKPEVPKIKWTQPNKMRFILKGSTLEFDNALKRLRQDGINPVVVRAHYNIMR